MNSVEYYISEMLLLFKTRVLNTIDANLSALMISDHEHSEIHEGDHFYYTDAVELGSAQSQAYLITTPDTDELANLIFMATGNAITQVELLEGSDKSGTTLQTTFNSLRDSPKASTVTIHKGTSGGTTDGVRIYFMKSGSAQGVSRVGMSADRAHEIILKRNTKYVLLITSGTAANLTNVQLAWYTH